MAEQATTDRRATRNEQLLRDLLARIGRGDERALLEMHRLVARRIFAFALNRLHDRDEAMSVANNTLYEIWRQSQRFDGSCQFMTWALGIARNKMLHAFRDRPAEYDELDETHADAAPGAFETLAGKELRESLLVAMDRLSPDHREVLHLTYFEELSVAEVAAIQLCPVGTVKTRLHHARRRMRELVDPSGAPRRRGVAGATDLHAAPQS